MTEQVKSGTKPATTDECLLALTDAVDRSMHAIRGYFGEVFDRLDGAPAESIVSDHFLDMSRAITALSYTVVDVRESVRSRRDGVPHDPPSP